MSRLLHMSTQRISRILLSAAILVLGIWFGATANFYDSALISAFFAAALFSVCIIHLRLCPTLHDLLALLAGTAAFALIDFRLLHYAPKIMAWFSFLGLTRVLILAIRFVWAHATTPPF